MDFWKIVGIVFLLCAMINLPFLLIELRKDKQKKQAEKKKPVQPTEPPKQSKQEEMKPQTVKTEPQKEQLPVRETVSEKTAQQEPIQQQEKQPQEKESAEVAPVSETPAEKEKTVESRGAVELFDAMYYMHQHECWGHEITKYHKLVQRLNQIHHNLTYGDIPEVDCPTVIRLLKKNEGHALNWETIYFTDYHYDDNGILRKIETANPDYHKIPANEALADVQVFDENGNILRHSPAFVDFSKRSFRRIPPVLAIHSGAIRNGQYGYERYELTMENLYSETFEPKPIAKDGWEHYWRTYVPFAGEKRVLDYWYDRTDFPEAPGYEEWSFRILKCSPTFADRLAECGKCGNGMTWKQVNGVLYIHGEGKIEEQAFDADTSIRKVVIAPGCTGIGDGAFASCEQLQEVELPEGLLSIGEDAFQNCYHLAEITLPDGLQEIGEEAFSYCEHKDLKLHIPDSVTEIGENAFEDVPCIIYNGSAQSDDNWGALRRN